MGPGETIWRFMTSSQKFLCACLLHGSPRQCRSPVWVQAGLGKRPHLLMGSGKVTDEYVNGNIVVAS